MHILLTGASRGLGAALCSHLVAQGHSITALVRSLEGQPAPTAGVTLELGDLRNPASLSTATGRIEARSPIDGLINCAGIGHDGLLITQSLEQIEEMSVVNFISPMLLMAQVSKYMMRRRAGRIINISSISAHRALRGLTAYGAIKAGLNQLTIGFSAEIANRGIAVNAIAPGFLATDMSASLTTAQRSAIQRRTPTNRLTEVSEVCEVAAFLLSAPSSLTGQVITIDGGFSL